MSKTIILYPPHFVNKKVDIEYEEEVDVGLLFTRMEKQKKVKTDWQHAKNSDGKDLIKMSVLLPNGSYQIYSNNEETRLSQVMNEVLNIYQSQGYKAPQNEIAKFLNFKLNQLVMIK